MKCTAIPNFPDYRIWENGVVETQFMRELDGLPDGKWRIVEQFQTGRGRYWAVYLHSPLHKHGATKQVHVLLLESFVGPAPSRLVARHKDGNINNNRLDNMKWVKRNA